MMDTWSTEQIADAEGQALTRMPPATHAGDLGKTSIDQYAIYDPESGDWVFADFD
ncbi:hypothetical protein [Paraburkholderia hayleyella]|uniref:hypothetical protein n=1 Tax=Paraburkholderia hayleyella TaxID=2152889 RepID=UPI001C65EA8F|nr:hypothetical protein [Paraburkholderia hayleyella]